VWALGLLILTLLYLAAAGLLARLLPTVAKIVFCLIALGVPISLPYWYLFYPSFGEFERLCASDDRRVVKHTKKLDFLYSQSCYGAFHHSKDRAFKGYECEYWPRTQPRLSAGEVHYFRFTRGRNWGTAICQSECANRGYYHGWEDYCLAECFDGTEISEPSFKYEPVQSVTSIVDGRLVRTRTAIVNDNLGEMVVSNEYTYFPYGDGFARVLGMSSGSAPTLTCERKANTYGLEFLEPNSGQ